MGEVGCLKDGNFQNLRVEGTALEGNLRYKRNIISGFPTAGGAITAEESGSIVMLDDDGFNGAYTLPAAEAGLEYFFVCGGEMSGATITAAADNGFFGCLKVVSTTDDVMCSDEVVSTAGDVADSKVLTLNGTSGSAGESSGGNTGDTLHVVAINDEWWLVTGVLTTAHTTPGHSAGLDIIGS